MTHTNPAAALTSDSPVLRGSQQSSGEARSVASFTPGPWEAWKPSMEAECWAIVDNEHSRSLAAVWPEALIEGELPVEANARLIAAAPDYGTACGLDLHPGEAQSCGPLAWLRSTIDTLSEDAVREAAQGDDPDAYFTMLTECRFLAEKLEAANAKARGEV